ncbi:hypothetical protein ACFL17_07200 [Pseudomonadota bacterium]
MKIPNPNKHTHLCNARGTIENHGSTCLYISFEFTPTPPCTIDSTSVAQFMKLNENDFLKIMAGVPLRDADGNYVKSEYIWNMNLVFMPDL